MNLPTKLTVLRIILVPVFIALVFIDIGGFGYFNSFLALFVFCAASFTDFLDGYLARKLNQVTDLGKLLDSTADKMLVGSALMIQIYSSALLYSEGYINLAFVICITVFTIIIICRELFISVFRAMAAKKGIIIAADMAGKIKTVVQMIALIILIGVPDIFFLLTNFGGNILAGEIIFYTGVGILAIGTVLAVISLVNYIVKNPDVMKESNNEVEN